MPATSSEETELLTIEAYQPVIPSKKGFGYPQQSFEQSFELTSPSKEASLFPVVTSQPTGRSRSVDFAMLKYGVPGLEPQKLAPLVTKKNPYSRGARTPSPVLGALSGARTPSPIATSLTPSPISTSLTPATPSLIPASSSMFAPTTPHLDAALEFNLYYDSHRESLCVHIHRGLYFTKKEGMNSVNSFVMAVLTPATMQTLRTKVILDSGFPAFDQVLEFSGLSLMEYKEQTLVLQVVYCDADSLDRYVSSCFTKLQDFNLTTSNQLTKRIDEGKDVIKVGPTTCVNLIS